MARFERNVLARAPQSERKVVSEDLKKVFSIKSRGTVESLAQAFIERYWDRLKRAVEVFAQSLDEALTYQDFPSSHQGHKCAGAVILGGEAEDQGGGRIPEQKKSLVDLTMVVMPRVSEDWAFRRYMDHGSAVGRERETHKNHDLAEVLLLTCLLLFTCLFARSPES